jgi:hypothetical protein
MAVSLKWILDYFVGYTLFYGLLIGFNKIFITKLQNFKPCIWDFLNYNIIFDIDISNYETDYTKIRISLPFTAYVRQNNPKSTLS